MRFLDEPKSDIAAAIAANEAARKLQQRSIQLAVMPTRALNQLFRSRCKEAGLSLSEPLNEAEGRRTALVYAIQAIESTLGI